MSFDFKPALDKGADATRCLMMSIIFHALITTGEDDVVFAVDKAYEITKEIEQKILKDW